jgi:hypothetical protein
MTHPLHPPGRSPQYQLERKLGPQSQSGCSSKEKNLLPLLGIEMAVTKCTQRITILEHLPEFEL